MNKCTSGLKLTIVFLAVLVTVRGVAPARPYQITVADRTEIIKQSLEPELTGKKVDDKDDLPTDFELMMKTQGGVVLSLRNIKPSFVPKLSEIKLLELSPREIQEKADREGDFLYLLFTRFEVRQSKVVVTLKKVWARGKKSDTVHMSGGAETYEYRKVNGKWVRRFLKGYIV